MIPPLAGDGGSRHGKQKPETEFKKAWLAQNDMDLLRAEFDKWKWDQEDRIESLEKHNYALRVQVNYLTKQLQGKDSE